MYVFAISLTFCSQKSKLSRGDEGGGGGGRVGEGLSYCRKFRGAGGFSVFLKKGKIQEDGGSLLKFTLWWDMDIYWNHTVMETCYSKCYV